MKTKSLFKILSMLWICTMIFTACMSDVELSNVSKDILIDESLVVPVGVDTIKIKELLQKLSKDNQVTTDPAGQGTEIYFEKSDTSKYDFRAINLLQNNTPTNITLQPIVSGTFPVAPLAALPAVTQTTNFDLHVNSDPVNERVDEVHVTKAMLNLVFTIQGNNFPLSNNIGVTLKSPTGKIIFVNGTSTYSFTTTSFSSTVNLPITVVDMSGGATGIPVDITIAAKNGNTTQTLTTALKINAALKITQFDFSYIYGFFKPAVITTKKEQIPLDVSSYLPDAYLKFANPQARVSVKSNVGTYVRFRIDYIKAFLKSDPVNSEAKANFLGNSYFDFFVTKPANPGDFTTKVEIFNSANAGTDKLFENLKRPDVLEYLFSTYLDDAQITAHPLEKLFFPSDGKIETIVKVKIPLYLNAGSNVNWNDTLNIDGGTIGDKVENSVIDSSVLVFKVSNGLPIKASTLRFSFLDSNGVKINTTLDDQNYPINAPTIDAAGKVVISSIVAQTIKVNVSKVQFEDLKKAKSVIFNIAAEGKDNSTAIHFTTTDSFIVRLGVFVKGNTVRNLSNN
jgi:hypothetical protein